MSSRNCNHQLACSIAASLIVLVMVAAHIKPRVNQLTQSPQDSWYSTAGAQQSADGYYQAELSLSSLKRAELVMVGYTNSAYLDWALNWAAYCFRLKLKFLLIASDANAVATLQQNGILVYDASAAAEAQPDLAAAAGMRFRDRADLMRQMGHVKVKTAVQLMKQYQWQTMVLTDTDTAWFQDPALLVKLYPDADIMVSTDCLSARHRKDVPRCYMAPGGWTSSWNVGVVVVRNTAIALASLEAWASRLMPDAPSRTAEGWVIEDQLAYSNVLDEGSTPWQSAENTTDKMPRGSRLNSFETGFDVGESKSGDETVFKASELLWAWNKQLKVMPLPPLLLANGQIAFEQRLLELYNITPIGIHNTFQTYHADRGKVSRMRENNLWLLDPPEHYMGKYLTYNNMVEAWIDRVAQLWHQHTGKAMVLLHKHLLAAAFQTQVLAEAVAAARLLKRVLVPPRFVCYCWQDVSAYTDMLNTCQMGGTDRALPMNCSMSFFVNVAEDGHLQHLRYPNFLDNPRMQSAVRGSSVKVHVVDMHADDAAAQVAAAAAVNVPVLSLQVSDQQLMNSLSAHDSTGVVYLGKLAPGWLTGLSQQTDISFVRDLMYNLTAMSGWCCLLAENIGTAVGQDMKHAFVGYQWPRIQKLDMVQAQAEGPHAQHNSGMASTTSTQHIPSLLWGPVDTLFTRPDWCSPQAGYLKSYNVELTNKPQHPCSYLLGFDNSTMFTKMLAGVLSTVHQLRVASMSDIFTVS